MTKNIILSVSLMVSIFTLSGCATENQLKAPCGAYGCDCGQKIKINPC